MIIPLFIFCTACASRPVFAPNEKFLHAGDSGAHDLAACAKVADEHLRRQHVGSTARVVDVAVGSAGASTEDALAVDAHRKITEYCLRKRGYVVTGWN